MEAALANLQENFKAKSDDELLSLASSVVDMTPESRIVLLEELRRRVERGKDHPTKMQLIHGWYTVVVDSANISFPAICPKCLEKKADTSVSITSQVHRKDRLLRPRTRDEYRLEFPHCRTCASRLSRRSKVISWPSYTVVIAWFVSCLLFGLGRLVAYFGAMLLSLPMILLLREGASVTLGDFGPDWIECRFQSAKYADEFASMNHALEENTESIQEELEQAVKSVQRIASVEPSKPDR
jgi:hypothetical protein